LNSPGSFSHSPLEGRALRRESRIVRSDHGFARATTGPVFEVALGDADAPRGLLRRNAWGLVNPLPLSRDPGTYETFIRQSKAEFGLANEGNVVANIGW
jgi:hypothetical protein